MFRKLSRILGLLLIVALLAACAPTTPTAVSQAPASQADTSNELYIQVSAMGNLEFFNAHKYSWKWAGDIMGVKTEYVGPAEVDANAQAAALDQAIARKPAGIAVLAWDPVLGPGIDKAMDAGIPVVTVVGDLPNSKRIAYIGSNQHDLGLIGGRALAKALGEKGKVAILTLPGVGIFDEREQGFRDAIAAYPGITVVQIGDTKADIAVAVSAAKDILQKNPDLVGFFGTDSTAGMGAATAVKEAGLVGQVKTIAMDRNSDVLQAINDGILTGSVVQDDAAMGYWALLVLYNYNHHQSALTTDNKAANVMTGPFNVFMTSNYVDKSNLQYFLEANKLYTR